MSNTKIIKRGKVSSIKSNKRYEYKENEETLAPEDSAELEEEEFLKAMITTSKLMGDVENNSIRKLIIFQKRDGKWDYNYVNLKTPGEIIEALAPLWHAARTALSVEDEYDY